EDGDLRRQGGEGRDEGHRERAREGHAQELETQEHRPPRCGIVGVWHAAYRTAESVQLARTECAWESVSRRGRTAARPLPLSSVARTHRQRYGARPWQIGSL